MLYTLAITQITDDVGDGVASSELSGTNFKPAQILGWFQSIAPTSQLKREYFLLVLSPQFCSLICSPTRIKRQTRGKRKS